MPFFQVHQLVAPLAPQPELSQCFIPGVETTALRHGLAIASRGVRERRDIFALPNVPPNLQREILEYLVEHRHAKDTVEGVVQWWIADRGQPPATVDVQHALDELVRKGWVVVTKRSPKSRLYGLEESCLKEIQAFLEA